MSLTNSANWVLIDEGTIVASTYTNDKGESVYAPIIKQEIPVVTNSSAIAIYVTTINPKNTWKNGGFLGVNIFTGLAGSNYSEIIRKSLALNKTTLIVIPSYATTKSFTLFVPRWFKAISWAIWEYSGTIAQDNIGKLNEIKTLLNP